jgi:hypothetical protein
MAPPWELKTLVFPPLRTSIESTIQAIPLYRNEIFLRQKYLEERLSAKQIASLIFSARSSVINHLRALNIPIRREDEQRQLRPGQHRYGERLSSGQVVSHKGELKIIQQMVQMRRRGLSYRAIAQALQVQGTPTKNRTSKWHATTVMKILKGLKGDV